VMRVQGRTKLDFLIAVRTKDDGWVELSQERGTATPRDMGRVKRMSIYSASGVLAT